MAVNLINSSDIEVTQSGDNIQLKTSTSIAEINSNIDTNTTDITSNTTAINNLGNYSTSEINTGMKWIDGKTIYRKIIDVGYLPSSASAKSVTHGVTYDKIINLYGICSDSGQTTMHIPHVGATNMASGVSISLRANSTEIQFYVTGNVSSYYTYVIMEYTKTS